MNGRHFPLLMIAFCISLVCVSHSIAQVSHHPSGPVAEAKALAQKIDRLIEARWKKAKIKPAPLADDAEFFRRLNLDLAGRIPSLLDARWFLGNPSHSKRSEWIEKLLTGERRDRYAVHFSNVWRSILVPKKTQGNFLNLERQFDMWLADKFREGAGYDKIVGSILSGIRQRGKPGSPSAFYVANGNKAEDMAGVTARVFLGVSIDCAQCHKHPFADWTRQQFWEFAAFFNRRNRNLGGQGFGRPSIKIPNTNKTVQAKFLDGTDPPAVNLVNGPTTVAQWIVKKDNPFFAKATVDHVWNYFFNVSLLQPILENDETVVTYPKLLDLLAEEFVSHNFDLKHLVRAIVYTKTYQRTSRDTSKNDEQLAYLARMPIRALSPEQLYDSMYVATDHESQTADRVYPDESYLGNAANPNDPRTQFILKFVDESNSGQSQTSILQALFLMNGKMLNDRIDPARNPLIDILRDSPVNTKQKIETLYLMVLTRLPTAAEVERLTGYVETGGPTHNQSRALADIMWALLNSSEFMLNH